MHAFSKKQEEMVKKPKRVLSNSDYHSFNLEVKNFHFKNNHDGTNYWKENNVHYLLFWHRFCYYNDKKPLTLFILEYVWQILH